MGPIEETHSRVEQAIRAYKAAFTSLPSLELYQTLKRLSPNDWETLKPALMRRFEEDRQAHELVDVYLFKEQWDAAVAVADRVGDWQYNLIEKVADRMIASRTEWVIQVSQKQAQVLMGKIGLDESTQKSYYTNIDQLLLRAGQARTSARQFG